MSVARNKLSLIDLPVGVEFIEPLIQEQKREPDGSP